MSLLSHNGSFYVTFEQTIRLFMEQLDTQNDEMIQDKQYEFGGAFRKGTSLIIVNLIKNWLC